MIFPPDLFLFIFASIIIIVLLIMSWQYRLINTGRYFLFLMSCALLWVLFFIFETIVPSLAWKVFYAKIELSGIIFLPTTWLFLVVSFTGQTISSQIRNLLLIIPCLSAIVLWSNPLHHWFIGNPSIVTSNVPFPVLNPDYQFWFYFIHAPAGYLYIIVSIVLLIRYLLHTEPVYKAQTKTLLIAIFLPTLTDILYNFRITPIPYYNFTTAMFGVSGILLFWILFRYQFLDLLPLARDMIIDNFVDGVVVIDYKMRLAYANQSAKSNFGLADHDIGQKIDFLQNNCMQQIKFMMDTRQRRMDIDTREHFDKYFDVLLSPVHNKANIQIGYVATSHDVTERVRLFKQTQSLAMLDSLTGIANRRHFFTTCNRELVRIMQKSNLHCATIMMIDLDDFKLINDIYGHAIGDNMLVALAAAIQSTLRHDDLFGRLGGDEFALMLLDVDRNESLEIAERIRKTISGVHVIHDDGEIGVSASIGIVHTEQVTEEEMDIEKLLNMADQALYQGKASGKNYAQYFQRL